MSICNMSAALPMRKVEKMLPEMDALDITDRQKQIVLILVENPKATATELSKNLSVTSRTIQKDLSVLQEKSIIVRKGSDKHGYWEIGIS